MIRKILSARPWLPKFIWQPLLSLAWKQFWQRERLSDQQRFGVEVPNLQGSERAVLIETICDTHPLSSVLEVGCAYGQNFSILAPLFPEVKMSGIDKDRKCVEQGNDVLKSLACNNAALFHASAVDLSRYRDASFDLVLSSAFLLYVDDNDIDQVFLEMKRVSRGQIILLEQHRPDNGDDGEGKGIFVRRRSAPGGYWLRDYRRLFKRLAPDMQASFSKVENPIWTAESWAESAFVMTLSATERR